MLQNKKPDYNYAYYCKSDFRPNEDTYILEHANKAFAVHFANRTKLSFPGGSLEMNSFQYEMVLQSNNYKELPEVEVKRRDLPSIDGQFTEYLKRIKEAEAAFAKAKSQ